MWRPPGGLHLTGWLRARGVAPGIDARRVETLQAARCVSTKARARSVAQGGALQAGQKETANEHARGHEANWSGRCEADVPASWHHERGAASHHHAARDVYIRAGANSSAGTSRKFVMSIGNASRAQAAPRPRSRSIIEVRSRANFPVTTLG